MSEIKRYVALQLMKSIHASNQEKWPPLAVFNLDVIGRSVFTSGFYENNILDCLRREVFVKMDTRRIALDVGANIGNHSLFFTKFFDQVLAFEPNKRAFLLLSANALLSEKIIAYNVGCSNHEFSATVRYSSKNVGMASLSNPVSGDLTAEFQLKVLDRFVDRSEWEKVDFIKIDVEGHELEVLEGARGILSASSPIVAFEAISDDGGARMADIVKYLREAGYEKFYGLSDQTSLSKVSKRLSRLLNFFKVVFRVERSPKFKIELLRKGVLGSHDTHLIIASKFYLTDAKN